jgi:hypothetical protein
VIVSQGTSADNDGKVVSFVKVRAVPPAANWAQLWVMLTDTTTNEQHPQQLFLVAGNYEATISGLRPNRLHSIIAWARNSNGVDGVTATLANFTTATAPSVYNPPANVALTQIQSKEMIATWDKVADIAGSPKVRRYVVFLQAGGGAFTEIQRPDITRAVFPASAGVTYSVKVHTEDVVGNESGDSLGPISLTGASKIDDTYITSGGVGNGSIAAAAISRLKALTAVGSSSISIAAGAIGGLTMDFYTFSPSYSSNLGNINLAPSNSGAPADDRGVVSGRASGVGDVLYAEWRSIQL